MEEFLVVIELLTSETEVVSFSVYLLVLLFSS